MYSYRVCDACVYAVSDDCASEPCHNDGACVDGLGEFTCQCTSGYTGSLCDDGRLLQVHQTLVIIRCISKLIVEIDECVSRPCQHGGICSNKVDAFECDCVSGYVGKQCETGRMGWMRYSLARVFPETCVYPLDMDDCLTVPCLNNATCIDAVDDYSCCCVSGYTGEVCETGECLLTLTIVSVSCQSVRTVNIGQISMSAHQIRVRTATVLICWGIINVTVSLGSQESTVKRVRHKTN